MDINDKALYESVKEIARKEGKSQEWVDAYVNGYKDSFVNMQKMRHMAEFFHHLCKSLKII